MACGDGGGELFPYIYILLWWFGLGRLYLEFKIKIKVVDNLLSFKDSGWGAPPPPPPPLHILAIGLNVHGENQDQNIKPFDLPTFQ